VSRLPLQKRLAKLTIISSDKRIAVCSSQLPIDVFLAFLERNVHIAIDRLKFSCISVRSNCFVHQDPCTLVDDSRIEFDRHRGTDNLAQESGRVFTV